MNKAILVIDMPSCCEECFALDFHGDYPRCIITDEQRGYTFNTRTHKMKYCPLKPIPEKSNTGLSDYNQWGDWEDGWNACIDDILDK
jgi:hypothetical protein